MKTFVRMAYLSYKGTFRWITWPVYLTTMCLRPVFIIALFALTARFARGSNAGEEYIIGLTAIAVPGVISAAIMQALNYERSIGTLAILFASSGSRLKVFVGRGVFYLPSAVIIILASLIASRLVLGLSYSGTSWPAITVCYAVMYMTGTSLALFCSNFAIIFRDWTVINGCVQSLMLTLTGAVIPRSVIPFPLGEIGSGLPLTHGIHALKAGFAGAELRDIGSDLLMESIVGVVYGLIGFIVFQVIEARGRRSGAFTAT